MKAMGSPAYSPSLQIICTGGSYHGLPVRRQPQPRGNQPVTFTASPTNGTTPPSPEPVTISTTTTASARRCHQANTDASGQIVVITSFGSSGQRLRYATFAAIIPIRHRQAAS